MICCILMSYILSRAADVNARVQHAVQSSWHSVCAESSASYWIPAALLDAPAPAVPRATEAGGLAVSAANMLNTCCSCAFEKPSRWSSILAR